MVRSYFLVNHKQLYIETLITSIHFFVNFTLARSTGPKPTSWLSILITLTDIPSVRVILLLLLLLLLLHLTLLLLMLLLLLALLLLLCFCCCSCSRFCCCCCWSWLLLLLILLILVLCLLLLLLLLFLFDISEILIFNLSFSHFLENFPRITDFNFLIIFKYG